MCFDCFDCFDCFALSTNGVFLVLEVCSSEAGYVGIVVLCFDCFALSTNGVLSGA